MKADTKVCPACRRSFKTADAANQHRAAKHQPATKEDTPLNRPRGNPRRSRPIIHAPNARHVTLRPNEDPLAGKSFEHRGASVKYDAKQQKYRVGGSAYPTPRGARTAIDRALDNAGDPPSSSVRAWHGGLPSLGRRR